MQIPSVTEIAPHLGSHRYKFCWECVCLCVSVCVCVRSSVSSCCKIFQRCLLISIRFFCSFFLPQYHFEVSFVFFPSFFFGIAQVDNAVCDCDRLPHFVALVSLVPGVPVFHPKLFSGFSNWKRTYIKRDKQQNGHRHGHKKPKNIRNVYVFMFCRTFSLLKMTLGLPAL